MEEKTLIDLYRKNKIDYSQLVKKLGPQRSFEIDQIIKSTQKFKQWASTHL